MVAKAYRVILFDGDIIGIFDITQGEGNAAYCSAARRITEQETQWNRAELSFIADRVLQEAGYDVKRADTLHYAISYQQK